MTASTEPVPAIAPSSTEFLATVAARELSGKRRVFAGVGLPTLAVDLAKRTVNPHLELVYESGVCGAHPEEMAEGIADSVLVSGAESVVGLQALFGYVLQGGNVDVGFLGAAQVDRFGSVNTSFIGPFDNPRVRLPGSGGAAEVMANAGEVIVVLRRHDHGSLPAHLDFCTSPSPVRAREDAGAMLPPGYGVSTLITPLGVLRRPDRYSEFGLASLHPGVSVDQVTSATGWDLVVADDLTRTVGPTEEDVRLLRDEIDTVRLYLR